MTVIIIEAFKQVIILPAGFQSMLYKKYIV